jgi:CPA1 family monovalent cation:H+ antiporter
VIAAFRGVAVPADLRTIVECESLGNDGVALVLFGFAIALASGAMPSPWLSIGVGILEIAGGIAIGCAAAAVCAAVLRATDAVDYEVTVTIVLAYGAYMAATAAHCSGIFATAAGAIVLRAAAARIRGPIANPEDVDRVWSALAFVANAVVFLGTGLLIQPARIVHEPLLVVAALAAVWLARGTLSLAATRSREGRITVFLAGMRGALSMALALSLPDTVPGRPQIIDATFAVVLITIVVQGAPLNVVVRRLFPQGAASPVS